MKQEIILRCPYRTLFSLAERDVTAGTTKKRLQIIARMTEGSLPRAFRDICQHTTLAASGKSIVTSYLRPLYCQFPMAIAVKESEAVFVAGSSQEEACNLSTCGECLEFWFFGTTESFGHVQGDT